MVARPSNSCVVVRNYGVRYRTSVLKTYRMAGFHTSVNDIGASTSTGAVIVSVRSAALLATRNAAQTPSSTGLLREGAEADDEILLNVVDLIEYVSQTHVDCLNTTEGFLFYVRVSKQSLESDFIKLASKAIEGSAVSMMRGVGEDAHDTIGSNAGDIILELDDVLISNDLVSIGWGDERSRLRALGRRCGENKRQ